MLPRMTRLYNRPPLQETGRWPLVPSGFSLVQTQLLFEEIYAFCYLLPCKDQLCGSLRMSSDRKTVHCAVT